MLFLVPLNSLQNEPRNLSLLLSYFGPALQFQVSGMITLEQSPMATRHIDAIDALVEETKRPVEEVAHLYVRELSKLQSGARVQDYLVLLTSRHVRQALRRLDRPRLLGTSQFNPPQ